MMKILVIQENKTLAKLIAKKISSQLGMETDIAYKLSEAKLFLKKYTYFLTLIDLNLPDAQGTQAVEYLLQKNNKVIVLSDNTDKEFRKGMLEKNIISYVNKSGIDDINYIIQTIKRLKKNQNHKILVVEDSLIFRKQLQKMLENMFFKVITVAHGEEALGMLEVTPDISLVLSDYHMPVMDGLELTKEIRKTYGKKDLGIIAISNNGDGEQTALFLKNGANDYINKPFSKEEFSCRINNSIEALENIHIITNHANRDFLTGLYNKRYFYKDMQPYFEEAKISNESFAIVMINIDDFKNLKDSFGDETADQIISHLADILRANTNQHDLVARFSGEEFCIVLKNTSQENILKVLQRLKTKVKSSVTLSQEAQEIRFTISIGAVFNPEDTLEDTLNQADMMLHNAKQNGINQLLHN
ncbi:diguanylate cyclase [bacterium]|nr:diguanylate cyclase [bacterium]MBU1989752.1 diguanylate cyclase [bacterium]